jgi:hypothetical protein
MNLTRYKFRFGLGIIFAAHGLAFTVGAGGMLLLTRMTINLVNSRSASPLNGAE